MSDTPLPLTPEELEHLRYSAESALDPYNRNGWDVWRDIDSHPATFLRLLATLDAERARADALEKALHNAEPRCNTLPAERPQLVSATFEETKRQFTEALNFAGGDYQKLASIIANQTCPAVAAVEKRREEESNHGQN